MKQSNRYLSLAVGTIMMVLLGLIYAWSIFVAPLEAEFGWSRAETSFTFTLSISFFVLGLIANGFLAKKLTARTTLLIAAAGMLAGFALCSRVEALWGLYIAYGVLVGFSVGIANNSLVSTLVKWFPGKTGTASGVLMMGFGIGGMVLGPVATGLMASIGWRQTFLIFGIGFAVIIALGSLTVKLPPADFAPAAAGPGKANPNPDRSGGEVLRRPSFWLYIGWFTLVMAGGLIVIGHAAPFAGELGASAVTAATLAGVLSLCNGLGRILPGFTYDRLGLRRSMFLTTAYLVVAAALLTSAALTGSLSLLVLGFVFAGFSYGGGPTTSSTFASGFYGMKHFSMNYALVSAGMIPGALLGPYLAGVLRTSSGGYLSSFVAMLIFGVAAVAFVALIRKP